VREVLEETGLHVEIEDYVGTWVDVYSDDPLEPEAGVINVAYYTATLTTDEPARIDPAEVSEIGWFPFEGLPDELAPPGTLEAVLTAVRSPGRSRPR